MRALLATIATIAAIAIIVVFAVGVFAFRNRETSSTACAATLRPGDDITDALFRASTGATICLAAGTHRPFSTSRVRPDVTLAGAGPDQTVVRADGGNGVEIVDTERFTLADVSVRGGDPAAFYVARARDTTLRNIRVGPAALGLHIENGAMLTATDVTIAQTSDFAVLLRRGGAATFDRLRVQDIRGIGVGAVDDPGPLAIRDTEIARGSSKGEGMVLNGRQRFTLDRVTVRGGDPAGIYVARAGELMLRDVQVESANFGIHLDFSANAIAENVTLAGTTGVALLLQRGGTIEGRSIHILDASTGVSAINGAGLVTLRDSEISQVDFVGFFAGVAGCEDLPPASLDVPACFYENLGERVSTIRVRLERVHIDDTRGPCLVFFPGVHADLRESKFTRCELTGLFAWGAVADVHGSTFENSAEHAVEYRAFPDPRGDVIAPASGTIEDSIFRGTRPLEGEILGARGPGPVLGGGILAQGSNLVLRRNDVSDNRDIGIAFINRSTGEVTDNRITGNGNVGLCLPPGSAVTVQNNTISGNRSDSPTACGGQPAR
jgi:parallel beta-helix repeat protein